MSPYRVQRNLKKERELRAIIDSDYPEGRDWKACCDCERSICPEECKGIEWLEKQLNPNYILDSVDNISIYLLNRT